jgi:hypothetical protein
VLLAGMVGTGACQFTVRAKNAGVFYDLPLDTGSDVWYLVFSNDSNLDSVVNASRRSIEGEIWIFGTFTTR